MSLISEVGNKDCEMANRSDMTAAIHSEKALAGQFFYSANKATKWFRVVS